MNIVKQLEAISSGYNVKRWHTQPIMGSNNNGHHSARTALIAALIVGKDNITSDLLLACLLHDVSEAYTGDSPGGFKLKEPNFNNILKRADDEYMSEYELDMNTLYPNLSVDDHTVLQIADQLDAMIFIHEEQLFGNVHPNMREIKRKIVSRVNCIMLHKLRGNSEIVRNVHLILDHYTSM